MNIRAYNPEVDYEQAFRIWFEIGWVEKDDKEKLAPYMSAGKGWVSEINGEVECFVLTFPGTMRWMTADLSLGAVAAVTVSRVARKQGVASRVTAHAIAENAKDGAILSGLGMFEQGFYNNLGFGTGGYEHRISFDPRHLRVEGRPRPPRRLSKDDAEIVHNARLARRKTHGGVNLLPLPATSAELDYGDQFGLGYYDNPDGSLSHFLWIHPKSREHGPYHINLMVWNTPEQYRELLQVIKSLDDQVRLVKMQEQAGIQLQDFLSHPLRQHHVSRRTEWEAINDAVAYWQIRMNDIPACLAKTHTETETVRFNLELTDPIEKYVDADAVWRGVAGEYTVTLGEESEAKRGINSALPTLKASVNAFTRLWFGVRPATGLAITDDVNGSPELLAQLDRALRLPQPLPDWDY